jgi:hypothetical protein
MAMTLLEMAKSVSDPLTAAVIEEFAEGDIIRNIPFENVNGTGVHYNREESLPGIGYRGINESYDEGTGVLNPQSEALMIAGGDLDVDRALVDMNGPARRTSEERSKVKALRLAWERNFIKGDSSLNPRVPDGLQVRVRGSQLIANSNTGAALSLGKLDTTISQVEDATHIIMSRKMRDLLTAASRGTQTGGYIQYEQDAFGRKVGMYGGLPILIDSVSNPVLPFNETSPDGATSTVCNSIYVVSFGDRKLTGIQGAVNGSYGISVRDLGELNTKPVFRTRVDWYNAIAIYNGFSVARLYGILDAPVVA